MHTAPGFSMVIRQLVKKQAIYSHQLVKKQAVHYCPVVSVSQLIMTT